MNVTASAWKKCLFLYKFIRFPRQIGSVTPSSKALSQKMVSSIPWEQVKHAAELGAGTGAVTRFIREAASPHTNIYLFEKEPVLRSRLSEEFPEFPCFADAGAMHPSLLRSGVGQLDCIVSGLPFAVLPQSTRDAIMRQIALTLKPGGWFVAFQYSLQMKAQLEHDFDIVQIKFVMMNVPPAFIYVCRKKETATR